MHHGAESPALRLTRYFCNRESGASCCDAPAAAGRPQPRAPPALTRLALAQRTRAPRLRLLWRGLPEYARSGWCMADHMREELVVDALRMALRRRRPEPGLIHHSDQGSQPSTFRVRARLPAGRDRPLDGLQGRLLRQQERQRLLRPSGVPDRIRPVLRIPNPDAPCVVPCWVTRRWRRWRRRKGSLAARPGPRARRTRHAIRRHRRWGS